MEESALQLIDIDKILKQKMGSKARLVPRFLVSWLKRFLHQEEFNQLISSTSHLKGVEFVDAALEFLDTKVVIHGLENIDENGRYTFASNHPLGGQDGLAIAGTLGKKFHGNVKCIVNDILMHVQPLQCLFVPTNKVGSQSREYSRRINEAFSSDCQMMMFPAGICSRKHHGEIHDVTWKKAFLTKSIETKRDIVPIHFDGRNSNKFYRIANFFDYFHASFNPAMIFLPDEMIKNRHKTFTLTIGKPIPWQAFDKSHSIVFWTQMVQDEVYKLAENK